MVRNSVSSSDTKISPVSVASISIVSVRPCHSIMIFKLTC